MYVCEWHSCVCTCRYDSLQWVPGHDAGEEVNCTQTVSRGTCTPHNTLSLYSYSPLTSSLCVCVCISSCTVLFSSSHSILMFEEMKKAKEGPKGIPPKKSLADLPWSELDTTSCVELLPLVCVSHIFIIRTCFYFDTHATAGSHFNFI